MSKLSFLVCCGFKTVTYGLKGTLIIPLKGGQVKVKQLRIRTCHSLTLHVFNI